MNRTVITCRAACAFALCVALPALAQQTRTDVEVLNQYAGTWAADCQKSTATRLKVDVHALTLAAGGRTLKTAAPITAYSYFGKAAPPAGFEVALLGEARPHGLSVLAMRDASGAYLTIDADPPLQQRFGQAALAGRLRRCP